MRVACVQFDVTADDPSRNLARAEEGIARAAGQGARLCVLPEMWPTSFTPDAASAELDASARALEAARSWSEQYGLVIVGSAYGDCAGAAPSNRLHVHDQGTLVASSDKLHLFSPTAEAATFSAGELPPPVVDTSAGRLAGLVCYDLRFPEVARAAFRAGAEILCVCAQWPRPRDSHWRALCLGRAVEGQWYVVATNRTGSAAVGRRALQLDFPGNSLIVSPDGEVLVEGHGPEESLVGEIDLARVREARRRVPVAQDERRELYHGW